MGFGGLVFTPFLNKWWIYMSQQFAVGSFIFYRRTLDLKVHGKTRGTVALPPTSWTTSVLQHKMVGIFFGRECTSNCEAIPNIEAPTRTFSPTKYSTLGTAMSAAPSNRNIITIPSACNETTPNNGVGGPVLVNRVRTQYSLFGVTSKKYSLKILSREPGMVAS